MKRIDRVLSNLIKNDYIPILNRGEGVFLHKRFCSEESIMNDFCPSHFGLDECDNCIEGGMACQNCWNEEIDSEHE